MKSDLNYGQFNVGDVVTITEGIDKGKTGVIYSAWSINKLEQNEIYYEELDVYAPWYVKVGNHVELCTNKQLLLIQKADQSPPKQIAERNITEFKTKRFVL